MAGGIVRERRAGLVAGGASLRSAQGGVRWSAWLGFNEDHRGELMEIAEDTDWRVDRGCPGRFARRGRA